MLRKPFTPEDVTNLQLIYHLKKEVLHLKEQKHTSWKKVKDLDKFEIIRKLETIRTQLTNIKTSCNKTAL
jgi:hypothetical protein